MSEGGCSGEVEAGLESASLDRFGEFGSLGDLKVGGGVERGVDVLGQRVEESAACHVQGSLSGVGGDVRVCRD